MNAMREYINCVEGLHMMHVEQAMLVCVGIMPLCAVQELNRGDLNR